MALDRETRMANAARRKEKRDKLDATFRAQSGVMTIDEFAAFVGLSRETLYRRMRQRSPGFPTKYYPSSHPRYLRSEVEAWFATQAAW